MNRASPSGDAVTRCPLCTQTVPDETTGEPPLYFCTGCGVAFQWPQPASEELEEYYDGELDTSYLFKYSANATARAALHHRVIAPHLHTGRVLDVGCGTGDYLAYFAARGWNCRGLELSSVLARFAREQQGLDVVRDDFMRHDFGERFDVVSAQHVLEHMIDPLAFLRRVRELLVDGGYFLLAVPNYDSLLRRAVGSAWVLRAEKPHLFHFTPRSIRKIADRTGFETIACRTWQFDMADIAWALRRRALARPAAQPSREPRAAAAKLGAAKPAPVPDAAAPRAESSKPAVAENHGAIRSALVRAAGLFRPLVDVAGYGAEIVAVLRKPIAANA